MEEEPPGQGPGLRSRAQALERETGSPRGLAPRGTGAGAGGTICGGAVQGQGWQEGNHPHPGHEPCVSSSPALKHRTGAFLVVQG